MAANLTTKNKFLIAALGISLLAFGTVASAQKTTKSKKAKPKTDDVTASAEPDKVLYDRAMADMKRARYTDTDTSVRDFRLVCLLLALAFAAGGAMSMKVIKRD